MKRIIQIVAFTLVTFFVASASFATPSQKDVFKSISDNVGQSSDESSGQIFLWILGGAGVVVVLALVGRRQTLQTSPRILNSPGRLLKEVMKALPLKPRDIKQVKTIADETEVAPGEPVCSPLVLLLCPSLLAKAVEEEATRADRQTIKMIVRRLGSPPVKAATLQIKPADAVSGRAAA